MGTRWLWSITASSHL